MMHNLTTALYLSHSLTRANSTRITYSDWCRRWISDREIRPFLLFVNLYECLLNCRRHDSADLEMACHWAFTIGKGVTGETRSKSKRDEKEYCESAINKSRVICKERTRKKHGKESKGEEICVLDLHHLDSWIKREQLDITCFIISLFTAQHVSDVNTSILRSLRLICWVISWVVLFWGGVVSVCRLKH